MDPLFPELPESLSELSDEELQTLLKEHEVAAEAIEEQNEDFIKGYDAEGVVTELERGVGQIEAIKAEMQARVDAEVAYQAKISELAERRKGEAAEEDDAEGDGDGDGEEEAEVEGEELAAEAAEADAEGDDEGDGDGDGDGDAEGEAEPVAASAKPALRRPPAAAKDRRGVEVGATLVAAAGQVGIRGGQVLARMDLADAMKKVAQSVGAPTKSPNGIEQRFLVASASYKFPAERILAAGELDANARKIAEVVPSGIPGVFGLVASGGLCAPLEPIYSMPNFASQARPVRDALPSFQAERGGVNVPTATIIGDITTAISLISEAEDALGGTFATKSCQDLECVDYTEVAVAVIAHCREYGNLNARAWPEKIAHENDLTMAAHARTAETFLLDRIKAESLQVTQAAVGSVMNAYGSLVHAITKATASIRYNLRMSQDARFRVLMPAWIGDLLAADSALQQFDGKMAQAALTASLERYGINISYYLDAASDATTFAAEAAGTLDDFPDVVEYAIFPEGAFIHVDSGSLELGLVRDSTLNSTNDFQLFGETFENVARLAPLQATRWVEQTICPNGVFPALGTALTC